MDERTTERQRRTGRGAWPPARDIERLVAVSLTAWEDVFRSFETILGPALFERLYPEGVHAQRTVVEDMCSSEGVAVLVAELDGAAVGFVAYSVDLAQHRGEVELLAVAPACQSHGVGALLTDHALARSSATGATLAVVSTGGDPGHAAARRTYEKAGFTPMPAVNYFKRLD